MADNDIIPNIFFDTYITVVNVFRPKHNVNLHLTFQSICEWKCLGTYITELNIGRL